MTRDEMLTLTRDAWTRWTAALARVPEERMEEPGVAGEWSVKDIIAHITWFEKQMIQLVETHAFVGSELWLMPGDERNAAIYDENRDRSLEDVRSESAEVHPELLARLGTLEDGELLDPSRFPPMPAELTPLIIIEGNTFNHYDEHAKGLLRWLGPGD